MNDKTIDKRSLSILAKRAKIKLNEDEEAEFLKELSSIVESFQIINTIDTEGIKVEREKRHTIEELRADIAVTDFDRSVLQQNAKNKEDGFFAVPVVVE